MPGFPLSPPRDIAPAPDGDRARRQPARAVRSSAARFAPLTFAPAVAVVVLLAEAAAVIRMVAGLLLVGVPLLVATRPAGSRGVERERHPGWTNRSERHAPRSGQPEGDR
jgi:hypothetical protein